MKYNTKLNHFPQRTEKPRTKGLTMVMDKGLSLRQAEDMMDSSSEFIDIVKLGFGTSIITPKLKEKIALYKRHNIKVYVGGTLLEAFIIRNQFKDYIKYITEIGCDAAEVSDGSLVMEHAKKCEYIHKLSKDFTVLSEVGSKEEGIIIHPNKWISMMKKELEAGAFKVIAEARESGTVGIFHKNGAAHTILINRIVKKINVDDILWETPLKSQQVYFLKLFGSNINVGNIGYEDVIPLETLRLGLRGDTFFTFLPEEFKKFKQEVEQTDN
jgi:phosphosulfolactate synthase